MRQRIETVLRWASAIFGALILGSCTIAGGLAGGSNMFDKSFGGVLKAFAGVLSGALAGFLGGLLFVGIFAGWLYTYLMLRSDLKVIHTEIAKLRAEAPPDPEKIGLEGQPWRGDRDR